MYIICSQFGTNRHILYAYTDRSVHTCACMHVRCTTATLLCTYFLQSNPFHQSFTQSKPISSVLHSIRTHHSIDCYDYGTAKLFQVIQLLH